jgi:hypothetical protein
MRLVSTSVEQDSHLPDAGWLWRKALLEQKQTEADQARHWVRVVEFLSMAATILTTAMLVGWCLAQLHGNLPPLWQTSPWLGLSETLSSVAKGRTHFSPESLSLISLVAIAAFFAFHPLMAQE